MDFSLENQFYQDLLNKEYSYIDKHKEAIREQVKDLYEAVVKGQQFYKSLSNDFLLLEKNTLILVNSQLRLSTYVLNPIFFVKIHVQPFQQRDRVAIWSNTVKIRKRPFRRSMRTEPFLLNVLRR
ncbi:hypothetical protein HP552_08780 [Paenibacillus xylanilyticus]|uniref:Uncharacterized protein n=2 Tax=Paenibacillus xylanilyticus TaxID=248903 RepID=A0A7Y6EV30_9BACL|nr:hypothetical protein [Paenibacillus xylanilyticus]